MVNGNNAVIEGVNGNNVVIEGVSRIDLELPKNQTRPPPGSGHYRKYLLNTECRKPRRVSQTDHGQQPHRLVTGLHKNPHHKKMWPRQDFSTVRRARTGKGTP